MMKAILYFAIWVMRFLQSFNVLCLYPLDIANITCEETIDIIIDCTGQGLPYVQAFQENSSHTAVALSENHLTNLDPGIFDGLIKLTILYLDINNLTTLHHDIFRFLSKLIILRLDFNQIKELEISIFEPLKSLEDLFLHNNLLRSLNRGIFHSLPNLSKLTLNNNQLQCLPDQIFASSYNLLYLLLQHNQLIRLDVDIFEPISKPQIIYLPVMCNCTENRLRLIPYVTTQLFTVQILVNDADYTTDWITRTNTCNSTMIDSPYCHEISEIIEECVAEEPDSHFTTSQGTMDISSDTTSFLSTKGFEETTRYVTEGNERHASLDEGFEETTRYVTEGNERHASLDAGFEETTRYVTEGNERHASLDEGFEETTRYVTEGNERHASLDADAARDKVFQTQYIRLPSSRGAMHCRGVALFSLLSITSKMMLFFYSLYPGLYKGNYICVTGTLYTVVASIIGGLASAVVLYQLYSRIHIFVNMRTRNVTESQLENVAAEVLDVEFDENDEVTRRENIPPRSHMYIIYLSQPGGNPEYRNMTNSTVGYNPFRRGIR